MKCVVRLEPVQTRTIGNVESLKDLFLSGDEVFLLISIENNIARIVGSSSRGRYKYFPEGIRADQRVINFLNLLNIDLFESKLTVFKYQKSLVGVTTPVTFPLSPDLSNSGSLKSEVTTTECEVIVLDMNFMTISAIPQNFYSTFFVTSSSF